DKLRMFRRQIAGERDNIFPMLVTAFGIDLLSGSGLAGNRKTGNGCGCSGTAIAYYTAQRVADFRGGFGGNYLTPLGRGEWAYGFPFRRVNRLYDAGRD